MENKIKKNIILKIIRLHNLNNNFIKMRFQLFFFLILCGLIFIGRTASNRVFGLRVPTSCMDSAESSSIAPPPIPEASSDEIDFKKLNDLIPTQVTKEDKGSIVIGKIADNGFQKFMASDRFKSSPIGRINEEVKQKTKLEMSLKPEGQSVEHRLKAQILPFQGGAIVGYQGYFGLDVTLQPANDSQKIKVEETIADKKIYFENIQSRLERLNEVGISWDW